MRIAKQKMLDCTRKSTRKLPRNYRQMITFYGTVRPQVQTRTSPTKSVYLKTGAFSPQDLQPRRELFAYSHEVKIVPWYAKCFDFDSVWFIL